MRKILFLVAMATSLAVAAQTGDYDSNRGFVHPGGLHTQADFDRVKQQLADGNTKVTQAYNKLKTAAYAQSSVQTYPVEVIVRGGGSGENYINACRGATMAYQNALRWKIDGTEANAKAAVRILMQWANTTRDVSGDSNYALAIGLYGYQFAQAAELMRDYEGWSREDFETFQAWMLRVWYPKAIGFLRGRNGTWENSGRWWQAPGHYWSNWGLCNTLCVAMIGILCDDVFLYNQGMSYFKYDMCGTFRDPRNADPILNDGLAEFLGNLVVTTYPSDLETAAYGVLGQMNESGRDTGHSAMALGLAIDMAKVGWSQGDDLFAYMDHRLAAGIEYVAAQTQSVANLPWVNYHRAEGGYYYSDGRSWLMTGPALGAQMRPYWGSVIGIYEGVKGVQMPFSEKSYQNMGIDEGGQGGTSGGYDHLGYSVLMNTREPQLCPADRVPTELKPRMEYSGSLTTNLIPSLAQERTRGLVSGKLIDHSELGGLVNTYAINNNTTVPAGQTLTLMPQLPDGEEDTGQWQWNTGETSREITVSTDRSFIYRVTYTNANGVESQQCFSIAAAGDCRPDVLTPTITVAGSEAVETTTMDVLYGKSVTLTARPTMGWGTYKWNTGATTESITKAVTADVEYTVEFKSQGGAISTQTFQLRMIPAMAYVTTGSVTTAGTTAVVDPGTPVTLGLTLPTAVRPANVAWSDGSTGAELTIDAPQTSTSYTATFTLRGTEYSYTFDVFVRNTESAAIQAGSYVLRHIATDTYMTANGKNQSVTFEAPRWAATEGPLTPEMFTDGAASQLWTLEANATPKYSLGNDASGESLLLSTVGKTAVSAYFPFFIDRAMGSERVALSTGTSAARKYWDLDDEGLLDLTASTKLADFPFELIAVGGGDGLRHIMPLRSVGADAVYSLSGQRMSQPAKGVYIVNGKKLIVK